ncbi:hypothetical protein JHK87_009496 [Glycine soja]|nr:hypothetical protein JHK87_009496 [Glycine soja]
MSEITFDLNTTLDDDPNNPVKGPGGNQNRVWAMVSPRNHSEDTTPDFLRVCFLCKRRLVPARDIFMYKGDSAFCSSECREQLMKQDERKDKYRVGSKKQVAEKPNSGSQVNKGETVVAL